MDAPASIRFSSEGGSGNDVMIGTVNRDVLDGVSGHDNISGRDGNDDLNGGLGRDWLDGGGGNDNLDAGDDASGDHADCGESPFDNDLGLINQGDLVTNCERLVFVS